jgi:two-component system response regulator
MNSKKKLVYMLVADPDDQWLTLSTLEELGHEVPIRFVSNAGGLFEALKEQVPSLILIDYHIAPEPGLEILKQLKQSEQYRSTPVIILTESPTWHYHEQCYLQGASTVIRKPDSVELTTKKIRTFFDYWLSVAETV